MLFTANLAHVDARTKRVIIIANSTLDVLFTPAKYMREIDFITPHNQLQALASPAPASHGQTETTMSIHGLTWRTHESITYTNHQETE